MNAALGFGFWYPLYAMTTGFELEAGISAVTFDADNGIEGHGGAIDLSGVVVDGERLFVYSGYGMFGQMPGNVLLAYQLAPNGR